MRDIKKGAAYVYWLVKFIHSKNVLQISRTTVQRLMFLLGKEMNKDFEHSMYHDGPYSFFVAACIDYAEYVGAITIYWDDDTGFHILPRRKGDSIFPLLPEERKSLRKIVKKFGCLNLKGLKEYIFREEGFL